MTSEMLLNLFFIVITMVLCFISHKVGFYEGWKEGIRTEHNLIVSVIKGTVKSCTGKDIDV